ncbi:MAG: hypothetical protein JNJ85_13685 [Candidatus Kapabacteria bacterium]|nr:hypothetical protein [Candidatus Kapabacteria bacterium]MBX7153499.1 hypothetical protein [Bacteroidota bacterium]
MEQLPLYVKIVFVLTTFATAYMLYLSSHKKRIALTVLLLWLIVQTLISQSGFYTATNTLPPRFLLLVAPPLLLIITMFFTNWGKRFIDSLDMQTLMYLHVVRIPVELVLYWLYQHGQVPQLMTFEGRNFDILSGISAPIMAYLAFKQHKLSNRVLLIWNAVCVVLLLNIVINAILSVQTPFQQFAFEQPNVAVLYYPFVWLPCCVVPAVLFAHLVAFRRLR